MNIAPFQSFPLWLTVVVFGVGALLVLVAGTKLAGYADAIAKRTGLNQAFIGALLLGVSTSLPEIATTVTGALIGNARLVAANLFGGVAMQIAILAVVDVIAVRGALTRFTPQPILLLQGVMLLLLLAIAVAGIAVGDPFAIFGVGFTSILLLGGYLCMLGMSNRPELAPRWKATGRDESETPTSSGDEAREYSGSTLRLCRSIAIAALVILGAGWALAQAGDTLSKQTNLGASFVGVALVASSTSLPELTTTVGAVRRGNHEMAVANILGTNCLEVALFALADICYRGGAILAAADRTSMFAAALGMMVTAIYLVGLLERRDRTVFRMGVDSFLVLIVYSAGLAILYYKR